MEHRACRSKAGEGRSAARLASFAEEHRDESHLSSPGEGGVPCYQICGLGHH
jgi:hypothetical protein